ncbi:tape measure protein [Microbacterium phage Wheelie]|nr:tape measure protein [Microbacterium phage Wheelie]
MAETVGRVDFIAGLDGRTAVRESRALGEKIGAEGDKAGGEFGDRFDRELTPRMRLAADKASRIMSSGLQLDGRVLDRNRAQIERFSASTSGEFRKMSQDTRESFRDMFDFDWSGEFRKMSQDTRGEVARLGESLEYNLYNGFERSRLKALQLNDSMANLGETIRTKAGTSFDSARNKARDLWDSLDEGDASVRGLSSRWGDLSHNTKQWTLIIGAVLAGMQDLSALSSAAGAGLFSVGGALTTAIAGAGGAAAVFSVLSKDISELPPELQRTATQFKGLGRELVGVRDVIASSAIRQMPDTFAKLQGTVQGLNPVFGRLGTAIGNVFDDLADGLRVGTPGFSELNRMIDLSAQNFPRLADAAGIWSVGLLRGLNQANPLTQQLIGYVETLGTRFDAFTQSSGFDDWIARSSQTFTVFGNLLDATGRALNDLVTPAAVVRTQEFMDNLTGFMPNLSELLDILGRLDVFGLAAQALNDLGQAFEPLAEPMGELADEFNDVASILIGTLADGLGIAARLAAPLAQSLADLIGALPPGVIQAASTAVLGLATAFVVLKGAQGVAGALGALDLFVVGAGRVTSATGKATTAIRGFAGKAGALGLIATGAYLAVDGVNALADSLAKEILPPLSETTAQLANATSATEVFQVALKAQGLGDGFDAAKIQLDNLSFALQEGADNAANFFDPIAPAADGTLTLINGLGESFAELAATDLPAAAEQFMLLAESQNLSSTQQQQLLDRMGPFKTAVQEAAAATGNFTTEEQLLSYVHGQAKGSTDQLTGAMSGMIGQGTVLISTTEQMSDRIRNFADKNLSARDASRQFEQAVDDLTESIATNGNTLDIGTEQGRNNERAIDDLAQATLDLSDKTLKQTGRQEDANAVIQRGRDNLIEQLDAFGITGTEAEAYADSLGLIVPEVSTQVNTPGLSSAWDNARAYENQIRDIPTSWSTTVTTYYRQVGETLPKTATGGTFYGAQARIIGEAGPEAVVPLNRPLNQVDPSVRELSAIAQGLALPPMAAGGVVGGGTSRNVIFEAGAIVVEAADDPRQTAYDVLDVVAEKISS